MEQAVGDQCPLKSFMSGVQWREQACCYFSGGSSCAASRAGGGGDGVQAAAWPGGTVLQIQGPSPTIPLNMCPQLK